MVLSASEGESIKFVQGLFRLPQMIHAVVVLYSFSFFTQKAALSEAWHDPRRTKNCQLHIVHPLLHAHRGCEVVQRHWMGLIAGFSGFRKFSMLWLYTHFSPRAAPNEARHCPRQTMNCQLIIVHPLLHTHRRYEVVQQHWMGYLFQAPISDPCCGCVLMFHPRPLKMRHSMAQDRP
jgi:hypothetical protein